MIDYQRLFHVGIRVPDIDVAMGELGASLGITWASVQHSDDRAVWTPERGLEQVALTFVYSCEGPQHVELLVGEPGSVWDCGDEPGVHHVGVWSDDIVADVERCTATGWSVTAAGAAPADGYGAFAYLQPSSGLIVELVTSLALPRFESWWGGGPMGTERDPG